MKIIQGKFNRQIPRHFIANCKVLLPFITDESLVVDSVPILRDNSAYFSNIIDIFSLKSLENFPYYDFHLSNVEFLGTVNLAETLNCEMERFKTIFEQQSIHLRKQLELEEPNIEECRSFGKLMERFDTFDDLIENPPELGTALAALFSAFSPRQLFVQLFRLSRYLSFPMDKTFALFQLVTNYRSEYNEPMYGYSHETVEAYVETQRKVVILKENVPQQVSDSFDNDLNLLYLLHTRFKAIRYDMISNYFFLTNFSEEEIMMAYLQKTTQSKINAYLGTIEDEDLSIVQDLVIFNSAKEVLLGGYEERKDMIVFEHIGWISLSTSPSGNLLRIAYSLDNFDDQSLKINLKLIDKKGKILCDFENRSLLIAFFGDNFFSCPVSIDSLPSNENLELVYRISQQKPADLEINENI